MDTFCLTWDSQFLGYPVGKVELLTANKENLRNILCESKKNGYRLIYVFIPYPECLEEQLLSEYNGLLVDSKVTYKYKIRRVDENALLMEEYKGKNEGLYELAYASGAYSRFFIDTNFGEENFRSLYRKWVDKSLSSESETNRVFVYKNGEMSVGFITLTLNNLEASIGLIAVDAAYRGVSIGRQLIESCKKCASDNHINELSVTTQLSNIKACSFYEKNGFKKKQIVNIYHFWI